MASMEALPTDNCQKAPSTPRLAEPQGLPQCGKASLPSICGSLPLQHRHPPGKRKQPRATPHKKCGRKCWCSLKSLERDNTFSLEIPVGEGLKTPKVGVNPGLALRFRADRGPGRATGTKLVADFAALPPPRQGSSGPVRKCRENGDGEKPATWGFPWDSRNQTLRILGLTHALRWKWLPSLLKSLINEWLIDE